jgi:hypothetical protein
MGQATVKAIAEKILLLKTWSGRRGSNPRPTAWKNDRRLKINDNGVYGGSSRFKEISNFRISESKPPLK